MQLISELIIIDKTSGTPLYLQIAHAIIESIRQGKTPKEDCGYPAPDE